MLTRQEFADQMKPSFIELKNLALDACIRELQFMTFEEWRERFLSAGEKYGPFDPKSIDLDAEKRAEVQDLVSYVAFGLPQAR